MDNYLYDDLIQDNNYNLNLLKDNLNRNKRINIEYILEKEKIIYKHIEQIIGGRINFSHNNDSLYRKTDNNYPKESYRNINLNQNNSINNRNIVRNKRPSRPINLDINKNFDIKDEDNLSSNSIEVLNKRTKLPTINTKRTEKSNNKSKNISKSIDSVSNNEIEYNNNYEVIEDERPAFNPKGCYEIPKDTKNNNPQYSEFPANNVQTVKCDLGCGRSFRPDVLSKHQKNCQKVFQSKKSAFNSKKNLIKNISKPDKKPKKQKRWQQESNALRNIIKGIKKETVTNKPVELDTKECHSCRRNFDIETAKKHIPICVEKAKMFKMKRY